MTDEGVVCGIADVLVAPLATTLSEGGLVGLASGDAAVAWWLEFVERFIQTPQQECLDHFIVFGQPYMDHLCREFLAHYYEERPHYGLDNELIKKPMQKRQERPTSDYSTIRLSEVRCRERLGGLLKSYSHKVA